MKISLNRNQIKYIVTFAMLIDHIAWLFVPTYTIPAKIMHFFGRLTGPTMAIFIAEGYEHTSDIKKYALRLGIFAVVSWPFFSLMDYNRITANFSVIYTLFLALISLIVWDSKLNIALKIAIIMLLCYLATFGDWTFLNIFFALTAHIFKDDKSKRWIIHTVICLCFLAWNISESMARGWPWHLYLFQGGVLLVAPMFIYLYNGESGSKAVFHKWFFYVFYPLHMLALWLIKYKL